MSLKGPKAVETCNQWLERESLTSILGQIVRPELSALYSRFIVLQKHMINSLSTKSNYQYDVEDSPVVARLFKELDEMKARLRASDTNRLWLDTYLQWYDTFLANLRSERLGQWDAYRLAETAQCDHFIIGTCTFTLCLL